MSLDSRDFIAIPTFERPREMIACLTCLREAKGLERFRIFVRDDASTAFDADMLRHLLPNAESIVRNEVNLGACPNQMRLLQDCFDAGARRVLVLDSDLIVSPAILDFATASLPRTDGVLGLYNSNRHQEIDGIDEALIVKASAGGAATFWDAALLKDVVSGYDGARLTWDWHATEFLRETKRRIVVSRRSYAQHLGVGGTNNRYFGTIDYGLGFVVETDTQARFMASAFDTLMTRQGAYLPERRKTRRGLMRVLDALRARRPGG